MKRLLFLLFFTTFVFSGCVIEDYRPDCKVYNYGDVEIINSSNSVLVVYLEWRGGSTSNITLYPGHSTIYVEVPAGYVTIWSRERFRILWAQDDFFIYSCDLNYFELR